MSSHQSKYAARTEKKISPEQDNSTNIAQPTNNHHLDFEDIRERSF